MIKVHVTLKAQIHEYHFSTITHHRLVVLCELFSLFIFTDSRRTLAEGTVAKHLRAGKEQRQVCSRLVLCTQKHTHTYTLHANECLTHTYSCTWHSPKKYIIRSRDTHRLTVFSRCSISQLSTLTERCKWDRLTESLTHTFPVLTAHLESLPVGMKTIKPSRTNPVTKLLCPWNENPTMWKLESS